MIQAMAIVRVGVSRGNQRAFWKWLELRLTIEGQVLFRGKWVKTPGVLDSCSLKDSAH